MAEDPSTSSDGTGAQRPEEQTGRRPAADQDTAAAEHTPFSQQVGRVALGVIAVLFVIFAVFNSQRVDFSWVFGQTEVVEQGGEYVSGGIPLIILLLGSFILGAIVGAGFLWRRRKVRKARHREDGSQT